MGLCAAEKDSKGRRARIDAYEKEARRRTCLEGGRLCHQAPYKNLRIQSLCICTSFNGISCAVAWLRRQSYGQQRESAGSNPLKEKSPTLAPHRPARLVFPVSATREELLWRCGRVPSVLCFNRARVKCCAICHVKVKSSSLHEIHFRGNYSSKLSFF